MHLPTSRPNHEAIYGQVEAATKCDHAQTQPRKKVPSNGVITVRMQCMECGVHVSTLKKASFPTTELEAMALWDDTIAKQRWENRSRLYDQLRQKEEERAYGEWKRAYEAYLRTPEWARRRDLVILRAQGNCEGCRSMPPVDVHHVTYAHAGEEFLFELVALCRQCHQRLHLEQEDESAAQSGSSLKLSAGKA